MNKWFKSGNLILLGGILMLLFIFSLLAGFIHQDLTLVTKDYYNQELHYDQKKLAISNAQDIDSLIGLRRWGDSLELFVPVSISSRLIKGEAYFYCPASEKRDQLFNLESNETGKYVLRYIKQPSCPYTLKISLHDGQKEYYKEFKL